MSENEPKVKRGDVVCLKADLKRSELVLGPDGQPSGHAGAVKHIARKYEVLFVENDSARLKRGDHELSADVDAVVLAPPDE